MGVKFNIKQSFKPRRSLKITVKTNLDNLSVTNVCKATLNSLKANNFETASCYKRVFQKYFVSKVILCCGLTDRICFSRFQNLDQGRALTFRNVGNCHAFRKKLSGI